MGYRSEREERAAREARRNEIRREISKVGRKISEARDVVEGLNSCQRDIRQETDNWNNAYNAFKSAPINSEVFVTDVFEGNTAETLSSEIPGAAGRMDSTCGQMESLCGHISNQIARINEYIDRLSARIHELYIELAAV